MTQVLTRFDPRRMLSGLLLGFVLWVTPGSAQELDLLPVDLEVRLGEIVDGEEERWTELGALLTNRSEQPLVAWAFEVHLDGQQVDGYGDLLWLEPVAPGAHVELMLQRLRLPETGFHLEVLLIEAWVGELEGIETIAGNGEPADKSEAGWRLVKTLQGLPVSAGLVDFGSEDLGSGGVGSGDLDSSEEGSSEDPSDRGSGD